MLDTVNRNPSRSDLRQFGLTVLIGLIVIASLIWWWKGQASQWVALAIAGIGVLAFAATILAPPAVGTRVYVAWMLGATAIGMVMVPLFMTVLFIIVLPPFALIRLSDPLRLKLKSGGSYWEPHEPFEPTIERMRRPF